MTTLHTPNKTNGRCCVDEFHLPVLAVVSHETFHYRENLMKFTQSLTRTEPWCCLALPKAPDPGGQLQARPHSQKTGDVPTSLPGPRAQPTAVLRGWVPVLKMTHPGQRLPVRRDNYIFTVVFQMGKRGLGSGLGRSSPTRCLGVRVGLELG